MHPEIPRSFNVATHFLDRHLREGRESKVAIECGDERVTYRQLFERVNRIGNALKKLGVRPEDRIALLLLDTPEFAYCFFGGIKIGAIPIPMNTLLKPAEHQYMLNDSRARVAIVSESLYPQLQAIGKENLPFLNNVIIAGNSIDGLPSLSALLDQSSTELHAEPTCKDDAAFWLYSSGSTGFPKGCVHLHHDMVVCSELYAKATLGIREDDRFFSVAKLFFAYGLGNALTFPLAVGATAVLMAERPTPEAVFARLRLHRPTIFCGVPTLYASMLSASPPAREETALRACTSAGEALPKEIGERWTRHFGVDILDGIGSTEMLHIFLSNRPGEVCYGTTGSAVPGYELRLVDDSGQPVPPGQIGELQIKGPTCAQAYWNNRDRSREIFQGAWARSGDKYHVDENGHYVYAGRSDDMLKVSGIYVSPAEVESALVTHPAVLEAAVVGRPDSDGLVKPLACVVLKTRAGVDPALADQLKQHVKSLLAPYKYPRWIEFLPELPKTATGKIQRFKLRALYAQQPETTASIIA
jgi:benzoate-CoA ligase